MGTLLLMYGPAKKLSRVKREPAAAIAAAENIFEMLDTHSEVVEQPNAPPLVPFVDAIEFRDVGFKYDERTAPEDSAERVGSRYRAGQLVAIWAAAAPGRRRS